MTMAFPTDPALPARPRNCQHSRLPLKLLTSLLAIAMLHRFALAADGPISSRRPLQIQSRRRQGADREDCRGICRTEGEDAEVESLEWGTDVSPEGLSKRLHACWIVSFKNAADRDAYLVIPSTRLSYPSSSRSSKTRCGRGHRAAEVAASFQKLR